MRKKNNHIILQKVLVENYAAEGKSMARVDGKVIFIEEAVPGDIVDVRLSKNKKEWAGGKPVFYHHYSEDRTIPFCEHFGVCGGCQWQMLPYEKQLEFKQQQVVDHLTRIGKLPLPPIQKILGAIQKTHYRNKIEYTFSNKRFLLSSELGNPDISAQQEVAGFHAKGIFDKVVDIRECHLQEEPTNLLRLAVKNFATDHGFSFYDIKEHTGMLRNLQIRICRTGEIMVNVVFGYNAEKEIRYLLDYILGLFPSITTLLYTINQKWNDSLSDLSPVTYSGKGFVMETLEDFQFKIGPKSFFQTNTAQAERLYQVTREFAGLTGKEVVYDLYCGTGSLGIFLSRLAGRIIGVEMIREAIDDANENAAINQVHHAYYFQGDVSNICNESFFEQQGRPDVIITDPPRSGMDERLVEKIAAIAAPVIVYVSCNPATQARDLHRLSEKYSVSKIQPVDMFPHTHHIENIVQLTLK